MDHAEIANKLKNYLEKQFPKPGMEITPSTDLLQEWFVDSLGIIQTVLFLETDFGVNVSRADINGTNFKNIRTLSEFIASRLKK